LNRRSSSSEDTDDQAVLLKKDARRSISQGLGHLGPDDTQNASTLNNEMLQNQHDSNKSEANQHGYLILGISP
jgi:hypothetical protein